VIKQFVNKMGKAGGLACGIGLFACGTSAFGQVQPSAPIMPLTAPAAPQPLPIPVTTEVATEAAPEAPPAKPTPVADSKDVEKIVAAMMKKKDAEKKEADEKKKQEADAKKLNDYYGGTKYDLYSLFDNQSHLNLEAKKWYDKLSLRGYTQFRIGRSLDHEQNGPAPQLAGDRGINGVAETFTIRRARVVLSGDVSDHLALYMQTDFAAIGTGQSGQSVQTNFAQLRDLYGDIYLDHEKIHRFRAGLQKVPYGFDNMQSSQNRVALDRSEAMNAQVNFNERDLGLFYYYTPVEKQRLFKALVDSGLKGTGNFGIFGLGVYNGQGSTFTEANNDLHVASRLTYPWQLPNNQVVEASVQGLYGKVVGTGAAIRPLGLVANPIITPANTGGVDGIIEKKIAATLVWYPQPFGVQAEWQYGDGPGLNDAQTAVVSRPLNGGYVTGMYRHQTQCYGIYTPYCRWQQYTGGYRNQANSPYGYQRELDIGIEWQIFKEIELTLEYGKVNEPSFAASTNVGQPSYRNYNGSVLRLQLQINY